MAIEAVLVTINQVKAKLDGEIPVAFNKLRREAETLVAKAIRDFTRLQTSMDTMLTDNESYFAFYDEGTEALAMAQASKQEIIDLRDGIAAYLMQFDALSSTE